MEKEEKKEPQKCQKKADRKADELSRKLSECEERITSLEAEAKTKEEELKKAKDDNIRIYAEFDTWRRRTAKEILDSKSAGALDVIEGLLPTLDDCERALKVLSESEDSAAAKEGVELIYNKLTAFLKTKGVEPIDALGKPFDTDFHEAVAQFPAPDEEAKGKVFDVTKTGYTMGGKVIRFAQVVVGI